MVLLAGVELYLGATMAVYEQEDEALRRRHGPEGPAAFHELARQDPAAFVSDLRGMVTASAVVFVGDSQGMDTHDGRGRPYPQEVAAWLAGGGRPVPVVSLHAVGANAAEQAMLILLLRRAGIPITAVVWSHSIFSQRKNEIRAEFAPAYREVAGDLRELGIETVVLGEAAVSAPEAPGRSRVARAGEAWERILSRSATVRFSRRPLFDKYLILRRSPLGQLIPAAWLPGTARQIDPPGSLLLASAATVEHVSRLLTDAGVRVVHLLGPINRNVEPRPFTVRAEEASYPALRAAAAASGARFLDLLDAVPAERFGAYRDGTPDAFHVDGAGHALIARLIEAELAAGRTAPGLAPPE